ncbi:MAG: tRNA (guanosine(46)-N7)-methyltransferase TrmB [Phycisphaerales bacterium]
MRGLSSPLMGEGAKKKPLDVALGVVGVTPLECPPLPDAVMTDPVAGRLDPRAWFTNPAQPFEIEIGPGKGHFIVHQAKDEPGTNYLGIEWEGEIYAYCADRCRRHQLANVRMLHANAADFIRWRVPDAMVGVVHLYYSDPWPKSKHHKNRVVQDRFLREVWRILKPSGELRVVTDHDELWEWDLAHFAPLCVPGGLYEMRPFTPPTWVGEGEVVGTNYERKMCDGKPPHAAVLRKVGV